MFGESVIAHEILRASVSIRAHLDGGDCHWHIGGRIWWWKTSAGFQLRLLSGRVASPNVRTIPPTTRYGTVSRTSAYKPK
ncbi:MAG: hypothetical protein L0Z73_01510 [Gammaproteobacteria bacterium]|nr:hypothetical protein [Gammaproteobacteria bacterium]